jgi:hypothetical protein
VVPRNSSEDILLLRLASIELIEDLTWMPHQESEKNSMISYMYQEYVHSHVTYSVTKLICSKEVLRLFKECSISQEVTTNCSFTKIIKWIIRRKILQWSYLAKDKCIEDKGVFNFVSVLLTFIM